MTDKNLVQVTKNHDNDREAVMTRVDKHLSELINEEPSGRMDPEYWHTRFDDIFKEVRVKLDLLGSFILPGTEGITYGSTKPREWSADNSGVKYIKSVNIKNTGLDFVNIFYTPEKGRLDGEQFRVRPSDIIMNKSGTGTIGRLFELTRDFGKMVVSQDTMRIRVKNISSAYVVVFLQSQFGLKQIERLTAGVSGQVHINFDDLKIIKIPVLSKEVQGNIEKEYKNMSVYHDRAFEAKQDGNEIKYKENIETAERLLSKLIAKTENIIKDEREDAL